MNQNLNSYCIIGIMSGTSLDGMDAVLAHMHPKEEGGYRVAQLHHLHREFSSKEQFWIKDLIQSKDLHHAAQLSQLWSIWATELVEGLLKHTRTRANDVFCLGVHGQTLAHYPKPQMVLDHACRFTIQVANLSHLAQKTGITTVGNFRQRDVVEGGQGAPFVPHAHRVLFGEPDQTIAIQNLGGVSNLTLIDKGYIPMAFDTGPANMWMDIVLRWHTKSEQRFDKDGELARKGKPDMNLVNNLLMHEYFNEAPPKSTGWEDFGEDYLSQFRNEILSLSLEDAASTMAHTTAHTLARAYQKFIFPCYPKLSKIVLCGGGAKNTYFREILETLFPDQEIAVSSDYGIPVDQVEALSFGILGMDLLQGRCNNVSQATGAACDCLCGEIALGRYRAFHFE
ncbi:MAG: anhydro-N-acetylmuramic acid kinase [Bdellovibrionota bacterium]